MSGAERPAITVYVTSRDYGRFLVECLDSVVAQTRTDWELLIYDEASSDDTAAIAERYVAQHPDQVRLFRHGSPKGLRACANHAIEHARGRYIVRLDADDFFDENTLLVLGHALDTDRDLALVYPNWTYVAEDGSVLGVERRKSLGTETQVTDLPPHGACTMVRTRALKVTGGYDESFDSQDGHELWLKLLHRFKVGSVGTPLFFYRQHGSSMSRDEDRLLASRRAIKRQAAARAPGAVAPRIAAVIPAKNTYPNMPGVALQPVGGKPLIDHAIDEAIKAGLFDLVLVTTDDPAVVAHCEQRGDVEAELRPRELSELTSKLSDVTHHAVEYLEIERSFYADIVVVLGNHSPLRRSEHIREAVDSLLLYDSDHVISTYEDLDLHFVHGEYGMEPLNPGMMDVLRYEREALFVDNGAIHAHWRDASAAEVRLSGKVGHIVMSRSDSVQIKRPEDMVVVDSIFRTRQEQA